MKARSIKLAACLLVSAMMITGSAAPALATEVNTENKTEETVLASNPASGVSLLLAEVSSQSGTVNAAQSVSDQTAAAEGNTPEQTQADEQMTEEDAQDKYSKMGVAQADSYVNIRSKAGTDSKIIGKLENNAVATVIKKKNGWYKIKSGSITGYVKSDYLVVGDRELIDSVSYRVAKVKTETLKVRAKATGEASVIGLVGEGDQLKVVNEKNDDWIKVKTADGKGYVAAEYVKVFTTYHYAEKIETKAENSADSATSGSGGSAVASYALQFTGNPYVWGGTSLTNGADCSGFVMSVYAHFGVSLPHSSGAQRGVGRGVSYSEAQPGDIICYSGHVGIYIGGGQIVHASNPSDGIKVSTATYKTILAVRRIF